MPLLKDPNDKLLHQAFLTFFHTLACPLIKAGEPNGGRHYMRHASLLADGSQIIESPASGHIAFLPFQRAIDTLQGQVKKPKFLKKETEQGLLALIHFCHDVMVCEYTCAVMRVPTYFTSEAYPALVDLAFLLKLKAERNKRIDPNEKITDDQFIIVKPILTAAKKLVDDLKRIGKPSTLLTVDELTFLEDLKILSPAVNQKISIQLTENMAAFKDILVSVRQGSQDFFNQQVGNTVGAYALPSICSTLYSYYPFLLPYPIHILPKLVWHLLSIKFFAPEHNVSRAYALFLLTLTLLLYLNINAIDEKFITPADVCIDWADHLDMSVISCSAYLDAIHAALKSTAALTPVIIGASNIPNETWAQDTANKVIHLTEETVTKMVLFAREAVRPIIEVVENEPANRYQLNPPFN